MAKNFRWAALLTLILCGCGGAVVPVNWNRIVPNAIYNVRDFGAAGNGRTDDSGAIQRALAAAVAHHGGTVFFPAGVYSIVPAEGVFFVASNVTFAGVGRGSVLRVAGDAGPYNLIFGQHRERVRNVIFRDLRFDQNPSEHRTNINPKTDVENVIQLYSFTNLDIERVAFDPESGVQAIVAAGPDHPAGPVITSCFFRFERAQSKNPHYDESTIYTESGHARIAGNVFQTTNAENAITAIEIHGGPDVKVTRNRIVQFEVGMNLVDSTSGYPNVPETRFSVTENDFADVATGIDFWSVAGRTYRDTLVERNAFAFSQHRLYHDVWLGIEFQPGGPSQGLGGDFDGITVDDNTFDFSQLHSQRIATRSSAAFHLAPDSAIRHFAARDNRIVDPPATGLQIGKAAGANILHDVIFERNRIERAGWDTTAPQAERAAVILGRSPMRDVHIDRSTILAPAQTRGVFSFLAHPAAGSRNVTLNYDRVSPRNVLAHRISPLVQTKDTTF